MALFKKLQSHMMSRRALFSILALAMIVGLGYFVVYEVTFLGEKLNAALTAGTANTATEKFDIKGFEALKLPKP